MTTSNSRLHIKSGWKYNTAAKTMRPGYLQRRMREYRAALDIKGLPPEILPLPAEPVLFFGNSTCSPSSTQSYSPLPQSQSSE